MEPQLAGHDFQPCAGCKRNYRADASTTDDASSSWTSSCHRAIRCSPSTAARHAPYPTAGHKYSRAATTRAGSSSACTHAVAHQLSPAGTVALLACSPPRCAQQQQQQQHAGFGTLRQQPLERLLEIAITLASKSLTRTMDAFQVACHCWAFQGESNAAAQALEVAEACMARTMHRMQIVQQLAAAVLARDKHSHAVAAHQEQQQRLLHMVLALQRQYLLTVPEEEEEGEEVSSSWRPAVPQWERKNDGLP